LTHTGIVLTFNCLCEALKIEPNVCLDIGYNRSDTGIALIDL